MPEGKKSYDVYALQREPQKGVRGSGSSGKNTLPRLENFGKGGKETLKRKSLDEKRRKRERSKEKLGR